MGGQFALGFAKVINDTMLLQLYLDSNFQMKKRKGYCCLLESHLLVFLALFPVVYRMRVDIWCYGLASPFSKEICRKQLRMVFYHRASVHLLDCYSPCFLVYYSIIEILIPNEYAETRTCATTRLCLRPSLLYFVMQMPLAWLSYLLANHFSFHQMVYFHFQGKAL